MTDIRTAPRKPGGFSFRFSVTNSAGITRKSINAIETGRMVPSVLLALKLAQVLDAPVEELFHPEVQNAPA